jgi:hypothetical protein
VSRNLKEVKKLSTNKYDTVGDRSEKSWWGHSVVPTVTNKN